MENNVLKVARLLFPEIWIVKWIYKIIAKYTTKKTNETTKSVVIFGTKGAGKTTLWQKLGADVFINPTTWETTETTVSNINQFTLKTNKGNVIIKETKDIGGEDRYVESYKQLIENDTFIFFLVNAGEIEKNLNLIKARLKLICDIIDNNNEKGRVGLCFILTHMDEYSMKKDCSSKLKKYINEDQIIKGNLLDNGFIDKIKNMIINYKSYKEACEDEIQKNSTYPL